MEYIKLGKITNTHGIKGELKIKSNFKYKNLVFCKNFKLYIGSLKEEHSITSYRPHQDYDMVILDNLNDIDLVLKYKGEIVYINKSDIILDNDYLNEDLVGCSIYYLDKYIGKVLAITDEGNNEIFRLDNNILIPKHEHFIDSVDINNKKIIVKNVEGLI